MGAKNTFDIPRDEWQSTRGARRVYFNTWQREWPHDDSYLRELANERCVEKCDDLITRMRENHTFEN